MTRIVAHVCSCLTFLLQLSGRGWRFGAPPAVPPPPLPVTPCPGHHLRPPRCHRAAAVGGFHVWLRSACGGSGDGHVCGPRRGLAPHPPLAARRSAAPAGRRGGRDARHGGPAQRAAHPARARRTRGQIHVRGDERGWQRATLGDARGTRYRRRTRCWWERHSTGSVDSGANPLTAAPRCPDSFH